MQIHYSQAFANISKVQKTLNKGLDRNDWQLKESVLGTLKTIVKIYARRFPVVNWGESDPPAIRVCNKEISSLRGLCPRTIRRHRQILEGLELIKCNFRGWQRPFDLQIASNQLLGLVEVVPDSPAGAVLDLYLPPGPPSQNSNADKSAPLSNAPRTSHNKINRSGEGEGGLRPGNALLREGIPEHNEGHGEDHARQDAKENSRPQENIFPGAARSTEQELKRFVDGLYHSAEDLFWKHLAFTEDQILKAKEKVREIYQGIDPRLWEFWSNKFHLWIEMAHEYVNAKPGRFIPFPWIWFDHRNKSGFVGLSEWDKKNEGKRKIWRANSAFLRAQEKYKRNLHRPPSTRRPAHEVAKECWTMLSRHGRPDLLERFLVFVRKEDLDWAIRIYRTNLKASRNHRKPCKEIYLQGLGMVSRHGKPRLDLSFHLAVEEANRTYTPPPT